jgi:EAL domain-containing protein (putative c-di-GMP-specific phosphodiesterase class I)
LRDAEIAMHVSTILAECALPADCLQLEVTESISSAHADTRERLRELKQLGLRLALDDFGTGYSSLSQLHAMPVDAVKIDRSFVSQAPGSEYHRALIEATVRVARTLKIAVVAEGIETQQQAELITTLGCDSGQGYHLGRPMAAEQLERWALIETVRPRQRLIIAN